MKKMKYFKTLTAVTLAASMVMGGAMTAMAAASGDATETSSTSTGTYEGPAMQYPTIKVTLPTVADGYYHYIADPNGLIQATAGASGDAARYANSKFEGDKGIFFLTADEDTEGNDTGKNLYTERSGAKIVENKSAQDVDITVKLEQGTSAGDVGATDGITYASSDTFTGTAKELYLAVTDGTKTSALSSTAAAVTATVAGRKDNFTGGYDNTKGYGYTQKPDGELQPWNSCSFYLTGALNTAAKWETGVAFPDIKVTWSCKESTASAVAPVPTGKSFTYSIAQGGSLAIPCDLAAANATEVTDVVMKGGPQGISYSVNQAWSCPPSNGGISISGSTITMTEKWLKWYGAGTYQCLVIFDNKLSESVAITVTITE